MELLELYHYYNTELADVRTNNWPLVSSPIPIATITFAYLYFVLRCGPKYMKDKSPYSCLTFIRFYNVVQIVSNWLIVYHVFEAGWYEDYFFYCVKPDYSCNPKPYKMCKILWYTYILKIIDYVETGVFVLRKKDGQISFLHLYHHVSTVFLAWFFVKYFALGTALSVIVVNSAIHVIMYTYYLLSTIGPSIQLNLQPVKPIITIVQMIQFVALIALGFQIFLPSCIDGKIPGIVMMVNLMINFILFYDFYKKSYSLKKTKAK
ncbi:very long chain fatty acid elongase AAEL008004-like isoform X1 [Andrena cerasifolii]|uniref:very long chain fatty acid elongase AAEL008004-like isoform X1 n=1 Tax=Andrena cerasifolii TaxID=2819439 RepID=UPI004037B21F